MNTTIFLTTLCGRNPNHLPTWHALYEDIAHGRRPDAPDIDFDLELAVAKELTGDARSARYAYLLNVLDNTPDPDAVPDVDIAITTDSHRLFDVATAWNPTGDDDTDRQALVELAAQDLTDAFSDLFDAQTHDRQQCTVSEIATALAAGDDPLARNAASASYAGTTDRTLDELLAIGQLCVTFGDQNGVDAMLRAGAATILLCDRPEDLAAVYNALLKFKARVPSDDYSGALYVAPAKIVVLDSDRHGLKTKTVCQALSQPPAVVVMTADPDMLAGVLSYLPFVRVKAPGFDTVLAALTDIASATGQLSRGAVIAALPTEVDLALLSRDQMALAFRAKGPIRIARELAAFALQVGGAADTAQREENRRLQALSLAATAVVSHVTGADVPIAIVTTRIASVVRMEQSSGFADTRAISASLLRLQAGAALRDLEGGGPAAQPCGQAQALAVRFALRDALGLPGGTTPHYLSTDIEPAVAYARDKNLQPRIERRLAIARQKAARHVRRNLVTISSIAAHVMTDGVVDAKTLADLLVQCVDQKA